MVLIIRLIVIYQTDEKSQALTRYVVLHIFYSSGSVGTSVPEDSSD